MFNKNIRIALALTMLSCIHIAVSGQTAVSDNPWASVRLQMPLPVAGLTGGVWLKGDLHVHSSHSTEAKNPVSQIVSFCEKVGLDFVAITDHDNHVRGDVEHHTWADPDFKSTAVLLPYAAEMTTTRGHANTFSAYPYNHQRMYDVRDQRDIVIASIKNGLGLHLSANHPSGKDHFGYSYDMVNSIEVWNSVLWTKNANAIMIWDDMLSSGRKITGRGGSDAHHGFPKEGEPATKASERANVNYIGTPTTWVFATERTTQAMIDALTNGRASVSANPYCPRVEFYADLNADGTMDMMMGDNTVSAGKPVTFRVQLAGKTEAGATYTVKVIKNGRELGTHQVAADTPVVEFTDTPAEIERSYYRVVVEGPLAAYPEVPGSMAIGGNMLGLSNPIFFNFDPNF